MNPAAPTVRGGASRHPLPAPRGPVSEALLALLVLDPTDAADTSAASERLRHAVDAAPSLSDPESHLTEDDDVQITLLCLYELHYRGLVGVSDTWEWEPGLLAVRARLESAFEAELRRRVAVPGLPAADRASVAEALFAMTSEDSGPGLSHYVARKATVEQLRDLLVHRSLYQLKEADPHTWAIPRLGGAPKGALVEIQTDEYGGGDPVAAHAALFAQTMRGAGLDDTYGAYVDVVDASTLASVNMMSMFGLHRRLRGAIVGHLAAFEMTSSIPNRLYGNGFRRTGHDAETTRYFDEHVEADAVHEQIAGRDLAGRLAEDDPDLLADIMFGAAACLAVDGWASARLLEAWQRGEVALGSAA